MFLVKIMIPPVVIAIVIVFLKAGGPSTISADDPDLIRTRIGGLYFYHGEPFTGVIIDSNEGLVRMKLPVDSGNKFGEMIRYYPDGAVHRKIRYIQGDKHGQEIEYWPNGQVKKQVEYRFGKLDGPFHTWDAEGRLTSVMNYQDGKEVGSQKTLNAQGQLESNYVVAEGRRFGAFKPRDCHGTDAAVQVKPPKQALTSEYLQLADVFKILKLDSSALEPQHGKLPYYLESSLTPLWLSHQAQERLHQSSLGLMPELARESQQIQQLDHAKPVISHFFFTACLGLCPKLFKNLSPLDSILIEAKGSVELWSYTTTPQIDSLARLKSYQARVGFKSSYWHLIRTEEAQLRSLASQYYFIPLKDGQIHSEMVYLSDRNGYLRGIYNGTMRPEVKKLQMDLKSLI